MEYQARDGHDEEPAQTLDALDLDALDFVARVLAHVPDPRRHIVHYYGAYSNVVRGRQKARGQALNRPNAQTDPPPSPVLATLRRRWAELIRRVYEVDPLICPRCRAVMRVVSFITQPRVIHRILDHLARRPSQGRAPPATRTLPTSP